MIFPESGSFTWVPGGTPVASKSFPSYGFLINPGLPGTLLAYLSSSLLGVGAGFVAEVAAPVVDCDFWASSVAGDFGVVLCAGSGAELLLACS